MREKESNEESGLFLVLTTIRNKITFSLDQRGFFKIFCLLLNCILSLEQESPVPKLLGHLDLWKFILLHGQYYHYVEALVSDLIALLLFSFLGTSIFWTQASVATLKHIHVLQTRLIAMHYDLSQPSVSCYDWWFNIIMFNIGYHVEHHDFLQIPLRRLPELTKMAPEYYHSLKVYTLLEWTKVCFWEKQNVSRIGFNAYCFKFNKRSGELGGE